MSEKYGHSNQTLQSETSRRTFMKTGAVVAGAALLGAAVKAAVLGASHKGSSLQVQGSTG